MHRHELQRRELCVCRVVKRVFGTAGSPLKLVYVRVVVASGVNGVKHILYSRTRGGGDAARAWDFARICWACARVERSPLVP
jgi:hypothetical protein